MLPSGVLERGMKYAECRACTPRTEQHGRVRGGAIGGRLVEVAQTWRFNGSLRNMVGRLGVSKKGADGSPQAVQDSRGVTVL